MPPNPPPYPEATQFFARTLRVHFTPPILHACNRTTAAWKVFQPGAEQPPVSIRFLEGTGSLELRTVGTFPPFRLDYFGWPGLFKGPGNSVMEPFSIPCPYP